MKKLLIFIFFHFTQLFGIFCVPTAATAEEMLLHTHISDSELADGLAALEVLAKYQLRSGLQIIVYRAIESGECDSLREVESCPRGRIFLVRSLMKEGPDENKLWITESLRNWKVSKQPNEDENAEQSEVQRFFGVIGFELSGCRPSKGSRTGKWTRERYSIQLWRDGISARLIRAEPASECP